MDKIEKLEGFKLQISDHLELFGFINGFTTEEYYQEFSKEIDAYARAYFSSHFVEAVRKILPEKRMDSTIPSCRSEIQSGFNACFNNAIDEVLENAERLVKDAQRNKI